MYVKISSQDTKQIYIHIYINKTLILTSAILSIFILLFIFTEELFYARVNGYHLLQRLTQNLYLHVHNDLHNLHAYIVILIYYDIDMYLMSRYDIAIHA